MVEGDHFQACLTTVETPAGTSSDQYRTTKVLRHILDMLCDDMINTVLFRHPFRHRTRSKLSQQHPEAHQAQFNF